MAARSYGVVMTRRVEAMKSLHQLGMLRQRQLRARATRHELAMKGALDRLGVSYVFQKVKLGRGTTCVVADFYLKRPYWCYLEVDGSSHTDKYNAAWEQRLRRSDTGREKRVVRVSNRLVDRWAASLTGLDAYVADLLRQVVIDRRKSLAKHVAALAAV